MKRPIYLVVVPLTALVTIILYEPSRTLIYKVKEPYFKCPLKTDSKKLIIRNDLRGNGEFGAKRRNGRSHTGIDIEAPLGTPVYASKSGVAFCGNIPTGYGKYVMLYHPDGYQTIYGHLLDWNVNSTEQVKQGDIIGSVGKTGNALHKSIQPHLHFEIRRRGEPLDPRQAMK